MHISEKMPRVLAIADYRKSGRAFDLRESVNG